MRARSMARVWARCLLAMLCQHHCTCTPGVSSFCIWMRSVDAWPWMERLALWTSMTDRTRCFCYVGLGVPAVMSLLCRLHYLLHAVTRWEFALVLLASPYVYQAVRLSANL